MIAVQFCARAQMMQFIRQHLAFITDRHGSAGVGG